MREADCLLLDRWPQPAPDDDDDPHPSSIGWLDQLCDMPARHKVLLGAAPSARGRLAWADRGIALAYDGMEIEL